MNTITVLLVELNAKVSKSSFFRLCKVPVRNGDFFFFLLFSGHRYSERACAYRVGKPCVLP